MQLTIGNAELEVIAAYCPVCGVELLYEAEIERGRCFTCWYKESNVLRQAWAEQAEISRKAQGGKGEVTNG